MTKPAKKPAKKATTKTTKRRQEKAKSDLDALPPEFREMTMGGLLRHFNGREAEAPKSVRPWLAVARKASRLKTIAEVVRLRNAANAIIERLTSEAL